MPADSPTRLEQLEKAIEDLAAQFASVARGAMVESLRRSVAGYRHEHPGRFAELGPERLRALEEAAERAIERSAEAIARRLHDPEMWTSPSVVLDGRLDQDGTAGWDTWLPEFVARRLARRRAAGRSLAGAPAQRLDHPGNRAWIALLNGAAGVDAVLAEFGLEPGQAHARTAGGGRFGLQPRTAGGLDPSGKLSRIWQRYREAYLELARARAGEEEARGGR